MRKIRTRILIFALDMLLGAAMVLCVWQYRYLMPRAAAVPAAGSMAPVSKTAENEEAGEGMTGNTNWREKFADKFTDTVVATDTRYTSPNLSITLTRGAYDTGIVDTTESGKHRKYGTKTAYTLADVYIGDITCLQTAFAQDTYGIGFSEQLGSMSARIGSALAVNGDSYSNNRHQDNGTIIRNGKTYRTKGTDAETCVLYRDGTMKIYTPEELNPEALAEEDVWQSWVFGPSLLDENGHAKTSFMTWDYIRESHPRTAIGYYEPGHYCLLVVDGRQPDYSRGMFLNEMAAVFEKLGCTMAYNLDGGHCSFMTMGDQTVSRPYRPDHEVSDGIFIMDKGVETI